MFKQLNITTKGLSRWIRTGSLAFHAALLLWLLHAPEPRLLNAVSIALGQNGKSVTRLYWSTRTPDDSSHTSSDLATQKYRHERVGEKLTWKTAVPRSRASAVSAITRAHAADNAQTQTLSAQGHGVQAGLPYGTL